MKTIKQLLMLTLVCSLNFFATSCSNDETPENSLIGKWNRVETEKKKSSDFSECEKKSYWEIKTGGVLISKFYHDVSKECKGEQLEGTWKTEKDGILVFKFKEDKESRRAKYTVKGDILEIRRIKDKGEEGKEYVKFKKV